jgi:predicted nucleic acid-binding protein
VRPSLDIVDEVFQIEKTDVLRASEIVQHRSTVTARDAIHIAIMERQAVPSILSFDAAFDHWPGLQRVHQV